MSDNAQVSTSNDSATKPQGKNSNWIIAIVGIIIAACVSGLFNPEIREFLNLIHHLKLQQK
ncbi:MAG: hypothetical protein AAFQ80_20400 [Cyanobacteria bacterium J06621_8]